MSRTLTQSAQGQGGSGPRVPGVILEVGRRRATVLADGRFLRMAAMPGWEEGAEVWVALPAPRAWVRRVALAVAGAALIAGSGAFALAGVASAQQVAAVVSVDINPSVQLRVDSSGRVVGATAMDADGQRLLAGGGLRGQLLSTAIMLVVQRAVADGFLTAGTAAASPAPAGAVVLAVAPVRQGETTLPAAVAQGMAVAPATVAAVLRQHSVPAAVDVVAGNQSLVRQAQSSGLSLGQQAVYEAVKGAGAPVQPHTFQKQPLGKALAAAGVPPDDVQSVLGAIAKDGAESGGTSAVVRAALGGASPSTLNRLLAGGGDGEAAAKKAKGGKGEGRKAASSASASALVPAHPVTVPPLPDAAGTQAGDHQGGSEATGAQPAAPSGPSSVVAPPPLLPYSSGVQGGGEGGDGGGSHQNGDRSKHRNGSGGGDAAVSGGSVLPVAPTGADRAVAPPTVAEVPLASEPGGLPPTLAALSGAALRPRRAAHQRGVRRPGQKRQGRAGPGQDTGRRRGGAGRGAHRG